MKFLLTLLSILWLAPKCHQPVSTGVNQTGMADSTSTKSVSAAMDFEQDIMPILKNHCTPCHFPNGKMYERMPFDQAQTLVDHQAGIFRRIKDPEEVAKMKQFLEETVR